MFKAYAVSPNFKNVFDPCMVGWVYRRRSLNMTFTSLPRFCVPCHVWLLLGAAWTTPQLKEGSCSSIVFLELLKVNSPFGTRRRLFMMLLRGPRLIWLVVANSESWVRKRSTCREGITQNFTYLLKRFIYVHEYSACMHVSRDPWNKNYRGLWAAKRVLGTEPRSFISAASTQTFFKISGL